MDQLCIVAVNVKDIESLLYWQYGLFIVTLLCSFHHCAVLCFHVTVIAVDLLFVSVEESSPDV